MFLALEPAHQIVAPAVATGVGISAGVLGVWLTGMERRAHGMPRFVLPFSAGVLLGVALFGLLPELALVAGWRPSLLLFVSGYLSLFFFDRYVHPVCPTCSHSHEHQHDHKACTEELHGFAQPLVAAAAIHSLLDGWSIAVSAAAPVGLRIAVPLAVALHKIPEGIALGGIFRAAVRSRAQAVALCIVAEGCTIVGAGLGIALEPRLGTGWIFYPLGLASGWIFYLGYHAVHEEWKRRAGAPAFVSALTGVAGAAVIQRSAEILFR